MTWDRRVQGIAQDIPVVHGTPVPVPDPAENEDFSTGLQAAQKIADGMGLVDVHISGSRTQSMSTVVITVTQPNPYAGEKVAD
jgi:hypothetical protein